jgi:hypothetical protein
MRRNDATYSDIFWLCDLDLYLLPLYDNKATSVKERRLNDAGAANARLVDLKDGATPPLI